MFKKKNYIYIKIVKTLFYTTSNIFFSKKYCFQNVYTNICFSKCQKLLAFQKKNILYHKF